MRKEQTLLLVCVGIGALLVFSATGKYQEVDAKSLDFSPTASVATVLAETPDPVKGLRPEALKGRALSARVRLEKRPPLPPLPDPITLPPLWVPPLPSPGPTAEHWRPYRTPIVPLKAPEKEKEDEAKDVDPNKDQANSPPPADIDPSEFGKPKVKFDKDKCAKLIRPSGDEMLIEIELKGRPDWDVLANWPNLGFTAWQLNKTGSRMGRVDMSAAELAGFKELHLKKTLENEYHEARIVRGIKDNDRDALISFAKWIVEELSGKKGVDGVTYGIDAVKLAIEELKKAAAISTDLALTKQLGHYYRLAYDIENELNTYLAYGKDHANDTAVLTLIGDAYEQLGALSASQALFEKAAQTGDPESRLRVGIIAQHEGRLDAAMETLKPLAGVSSVGARALVEMAWIAIAQGHPEEAAGYAAQAKKDGATPSLNLALGSILYGQRKYADAAATFAAAKGGDKGSVWQSDRGIALVGAASSIADYEAAQKEFDACLEADPLNLVDPLFGTGSSLQHRADKIQGSNDAFETARVRSPDSAWILLRLGTIRLRDGRFAEALDLGRRLLDVAPGCNDGLWLVGRAAEAVARADDLVKKAASQALLDAASRAKPTDADEVAALTELAAPATPETRRTEYYFALAIAYLRRACDKEPDNRDFIHDYARVLVLGGRLDDAVKTLETATDVKSGVGRSDPRLFSLLAWARFLAKRPSADALESIQRGLRAQPDDETRKWLESVQKIINDWEKTRVWEDTFNRPPGADVGNGWKETDKSLGIAISLDEGKALFKTERVKDSAPTRDGATRLYRDDMELNRFRVLDTSFKACAGVESIVVMNVGMLADRAGSDNSRKSSGRGGELGIGCDRNGNMVLWAPTGKDAPHEIVLKDAAGVNRPWPMDDFHRVRIIRKDDAKGIFEVWLDDERITLGTPEKPQTTFEVLGLSSTVGRNFALGFLVDADAGAQVDVEVEFVQVTKTNK